MIKSPNRPNTPIILSIGISVAALILVLSACNTADNPQMPNSSANRNTFTPSTLPPSTPTIDNGDLENIPIATFSITSSYHTVPTDVIREIAFYYPGAGGGGGGGG